MNYAQEYKKTKIVENIKVTLNDDQYWHIKSQFWFDISFETKNLASEKLIWSVYFAEESKEENKQSLKNIGIRNRAGSVQIKLNVPAPDLDKINMENILKNGCYVGITCSLSENALHEVRYYFEVFRPEDSGLDESQLKIIKVGLPSTVSFMQLQPSEPKMEYVRKIVKKSEIETPNNYTVKSELKVSDSFQPLHPVLLEDSGFSEKIEFYKSTPMKGIRK